MHLVTHLDNVATSIYNPYSTIHVVYKYYLQCIVVAQQLWKPAQSLTLCTFYYLYYIHATVIFCCVVESSYSTIETILCCQVKCFV